MQPQAHPALQRIERALYPVAPPSRDEGGSAALYGSGRTCPASGLEGRQHQPPAQLPGPPLALIGPPGNPLAQRASRCRHRITEAMQKRPRVKPLRGRQAKRHPQTAMWIVGRCHAFPQNHGAPCQHAHLAPNRVDRVQRPSPERACEYRPSKRLILAHPARHDVAEGSGHGAFAAGSHAGQCMDLGRQHHEVDQGPAAVLVRTDEAAAHLGLQFRSGQKAATQRRLPAQAPYASAGIAIRIRPTVDHLSRTPYRPVVIDLWAPHIVMTIPRRPAPPDFPEWESSRSVASGTPNDKAVIP